MTFDLVAIVICLLVLVGLARPLLFNRNTAPVLAESEADSPEHLWQAEKDRLLDLLRENDVALAEGRIDRASHNQVASDLRIEAEQAVERLRQIRSHHQDSEEREQRLVTLPFSLAGLIAVVGVAIVVHVLANSGDINMDVSPHASGQIPLSEEQVAEGIPSDGAPPIADDGTPDIAAMVARLESRIHDGEPTEDDFRMLLRSYQVLERGDAAIEVLSMASARFPDNVEFKLMLLRGTLQDVDFEPTPELDQAVDVVLHDQPGLLEAHWYRGLIYARQGRIEAAQEKLRWLRPQVAERPEALRAIDVLLAELSTSQNQPDSTE